MHKFRRLKSQKFAGQELDFESLSEEDLKDMIVYEGISTYEIAELFSIDITIVEEKSQFAIEVNKLLDKQYQKFMKHKKLNSTAKKYIYDKKDVNKISKALTHFSFRNGPVENMHADGKLTEEDMKTLNKFMVNRLAYVFDLILNDKWGMFKYLIESTDNWYGHNWDDAELDNGNIDKQFKLELEVALTKEK